MEKKNENANLCLSDLLEQAIAEDYEKDSRETHEAVLELLKRCADEEETLLVPVRPWMENEPESPELAVPDMPELCKLVLHTDKDYDFLTASTSQEALQPLAESMVTVTYSFRDLLRDAFGNKRYEGVILNPGEREIRLGRKFMARLLDEPFTDDLKDGELLLAPRHVIDTAEILRAWSAGWEDADDPTEDWRLLYYPIMADGTVLLVFGMNSLIPTPEHWEHASSYFRVLHYSMQGKKPKLLHSYRFNCTDLDVNTVFLRDGVLMGCCHTARERFCHVMEMYPEGGANRIGVGDDVCVLAARSDGSLCVGYENNLLDKSRKPVAVFMPDGECDGSVTAEHAIYCSDLNLDCDEELWYHLCPSRNLCRIHKGSILRYEVALQGFDGFGLSSDRKKLLAGWSNGDNQCVFYAMDLVDGDYCNPRPVKLDMPGADTEDPREAAYLGRPSFMKNRMLARCNDKLYFYDIDTLLGK